MVACLYYCLMNILQVLGHFVVGLGAGKAIYLEYIQVNTSCMYSVCTSKNVIGDLAGRARVTLRRPHTGNVGYAPALETQMVIQNCLQPLYSKITCVWLAAINYLQVHTNGRDGTPYGPRPEDCRCYARPGFPNQKSRFPWHNPNGLESDLAFPLAGSDASLASI